MTRITSLRVLLGLSAALLLGACVETGDGTGTAVPGAGLGAGLRGTGAEVEAPDVFHASESALWDGRPSLGGIWVASPDAVDPERVLMVNPATGKSVKGALFRRERDNPGPRLQLSSDAAEALGVVAGMPTEIQVTALRKDEAAEPVAAEPAAVESVAADAGDAPRADAAEVAAAALDAVAAAEAGTDPAADAVVETAPKPKTWKEKRAEAKAAREAEKAAAAAEDAATEATSAPADTDADTADTGTAETIAVSEIESAPLDAGAPEAATEKPATVETASPAATDPAPAAGGAMRTIQIGSFAKEDNAKRAVEALSKIGIVARSTKTEKDGKVLWGVVATGDAALLQKIRDAGFADAYFLK